MFQCLNSLTKVNGEKASEEMFFHSLLYTAGLGFFGKHLLSSLPMHQTVVLSEKTSHS